MKIKKRELAISIMLIVFILLFTGCSSKPEDTIEKFEKAYNKLDVKGMIECLEPTTAKAINAGINLTGDLLNIDLSSMIDLIPILPKLLNENNNDSMPKIKLNVIDTKIEGDSAVVNTEAILSESGENKVYTAEFIMTEVDGKWYIVDVR